MGDQGVATARREQVIDPRTVGIHPPLRGRYLRPRGILVDQTPQKLLDPDPNRLGAWIFNNGGQIELPIPLPGAASGAGLALAQFLDSGSVQVPGYVASTFKSIYLRVDTALAWAVAAQAKIQLIVGRAPWSPVSGAASGAGGDTQNFLKGATANLGGAGATSLARGLWPFSPADIADLQWHAPYVGAELQFGSALTAGAGALFLEMAGGPLLLIGEDSQINPALVGDRSGTFALPAESAPMWVQADGELWAAATPGGAIDVRIWEVRIGTKPPGAPAY